MADFYIRYSDERNKIDQTIDLEKKNYLVGREYTADIRITDDYLTVSRKQAEIVKTIFGYKIQHISKNNDTWLKRVNVDTRVDSETGKETEERNRETKKVETFGELLQHHDEIILPGTEGNVRIVFIDKSKSLCTITLRNANEKGDPGEKYISTKPSDNEYYFKENQRIEFTVQEKQSFANLYKREGAKVDHYTIAGEADAANRINAIRNKLTKFCNVTKDFYIKTHPGSMYSFENDWIKKE